MIAKASYTYPVTQPYAEVTCSPQLLCGLGSIFLDNCWQHYFLPDTHTHCIHVHTKTHKCMHAHTHTCTQTSMYSTNTPNEQMGGSQESVHMMRHLELLPETGTPGFILKPILSNHCVTFSKILNLSGQMQNTGSN